jgi:hypothetical protein
MPQVRRHVRDGGRAPGGVVGYPVDWAFHEVAYLACRMHWTRAELLSLDHRERRRWVSEVAALEEKGG